MSGNEIPEHLKRRHPNLTPEGMADFREKLNAVKRQALRIVSDPELLRRMPEHEQRMYMRWAYGRKAPNDPDANVAPETPREDR